jgi:ribosomal protein L13E
MGKRLRNKPLKPDAALDSEFRVISAPSNFKVRCGRGLVSQELDHTGVIIRPSG